MTRSETNLDASVEESGPVRADESGPTDADEDVVQKAEELKHVPAAILPSKAEVESHSVSHLQPEDRAHDTFPVLVVRDRKSKGIWSHPVPSTGVTHPFPARALMADVDFVEYRRVILKSDQKPSIVALCDAVKNGWHGDTVPEASPKGESKRKGEVERAVQ